MTLNVAIIDYSAGVFLRYFRSGANVEGDTPRLDLARDIDILKAHWALSAPVRALMKYALANPHETQALLHHNLRVDDAVARGRIDARRTWIFRRQTGQPNALITHEPVRSFNTGPNLLLAWVIREAATYTSSLLSWQGQHSPYRTIIESAHVEVRLVQRLESLREPLRAVSLGQRPTTAALRVAARSRKRLYTLAVEAYNLLRGVEQYNPRAIEQVARSALFAPLEDWRRFELAVALGVGEALARASGGQLDLHLLGTTSSAPIISAGRFDIYWQQITHYHQPAPLEPSEIAVKGALAAFGMSTGTERPDIIVVDRVQGAVASIVEVKYIAGDTAAARFREAVEQVVRYARSYANEGANSPLLARSLVALSSGAPLRLTSEGPAPFSVDFPALTRIDGLDAWAAAIAAPVH